jgi:hypothetical protein
MMTAAPSPFCRSSVMGLVCDLLDGHDDATPHHLVAGHCPTHGRPYSRIPDPRTGFPLCAACHLPLVPKHHLDALRGWA